uniref:Uncharacterized protein n=1 Tax=Amphilophus citrinellus TaxID=61819 RepID=A0A3Q0RW95_AMPCI
MNLLVEKICRERIKRSTEQLRSLLSPEFLKHQPDYKLEKAGDDSLLPETSAGYSRCVQKMMSFLHLLNHINQPHIKTRENKSPVNSALWRPW